MTRYSPILTLTFFLFFTEVTAETILLCSISNSKTKNIDWILAEKFKFSEKKNLSRETKREIKSFDGRGWAIKPSEDDYKYAVVKLKNDNEDGTKKISIEFTMDMLIHHSRYDNNSAFRVVNYDFQIATDKYYHPIKIKNRQYDNGSLKCYKKGGVGGLYTDCTVATYESIEINRENLMLYDRDYESVWREYDYGYAQLMNKRDGFESEGKIDQYYCGLSDEEGEQKFKDRYSKLTNIYIDIVKREQKKLDQKKAKDKEDQLNKNKI